MAESSVVYRDDRIIGHGSGDLVRVVFFTTLSFGLFWLNGVLVLAQVHVCARNMNVRNIYVRLC